MRFWPFPEKKKAEKLEKWQKMGKFRGLGAIFLFFGAIFPLFWGRPETYIFPFSGLHQANGIAMLEVIVDD